MTRLRIAAAYTASNGRPVAAISIDLLARVFSMGKLHHAMTGTVGAEAQVEGGEWTVRKALLSRSARRLMEGWVRVPAN